MGWIDTLKVLTMILVVMGHCSYYTIKTPFGGVENLSADGGYSPAFRLLQFVTSAIYKFHMPLFMAVSGACFSLGVRKYEAVGPLMRNKARRLLAPFLLVTTFVAVPLKCLGGYYSRSEHILRDIVCGQYLLLGNSHLWFVVSLFYIFIVFYYLEKSHVPKNFVYWGALLGLSWLASGMGHFLPQSFGGMLGLSGMMKHLLFFATGFSAFKHWDGLKPLPAWKQALSWAGFAAMTGLCVHIRGCTDVFAVKAVLRFPADTVLALWGCANMAFLAKSADRSVAVKRSRAYRFMNRHSYGLYLYSDPFNYVMIAWLVSWFGQSLFTDNAVPLCACAIRFFGSVLFASLLIVILNRAGKAGCKQILIRQK